MLLLNEEDDDKSIGTVSAILFYILALQTSLTSLEPEKRFVRLCRNFCLLFTAVLHFVHNLVNPILMSLSASHNPYIHRFVFKIFLYKMSDFECIDQVFQLGMNFRWVNIFELPSEYLMFLMNECASVAIFCKIEILVLFNKGCFQANIAKKVTSKASFPALKNWFELLMSLNVLCNF